MTASLVLRRGSIVAAAVFAAAAIWSVHHAMAAANLATGRGHRFTLVYALMYCLLVWQLGMAYLERPIRAGRRRQTLNSLSVVAIVPVYNEDPAALRECIRSLLTQHRRPQAVYVVDDGSNVNYGDIQWWACRMANETGVVLVWRHQPNHGKRHAQAAAVRATPGADIYWTVDSDTVSDPRALQELLKPFLDRRVQSVAGIVLAANVRRSFLTRFTDLWFVTAQMVDRSALSVMGSVWVNSGPIAAYRAEVIRDNLDGYLSETFAGRGVRFSDDSMLTLYAMLRGRTVQQPTAFAYSLMPETVSHHLRQFVRWMRGSTIRSLWRLRYLSMRSPAYWLQLTRWTQTFLATIVFATVAAIMPTNNPTTGAALWLIAVPVFVGYAQTLRYMCVRRSDQSAFYQWCTWALTPVAVLWAMFVLRAVRWYGVATCWRTGWGTRSAGVEVSLVGKAE